VDNRDEQYKLDQMIEERSTALETQSMDLELDNLGLSNYIQGIKDEQNLALALLGGIFAALISALLWGLISAAANFQIGWMAIGVGFLVGITVRYLGKGMDPIFGIIGAVFAFLGCLIGNVIAILIIISREFATPIWDVVYLFMDTPLQIFEILIETSSIIDLLFYAFAIYFGYKSSIRKISKAEINQFVRAKPKAH